MEMRVISNELAPEYRRDDIIIVDPAVRPRDDGEQAAKRALLVKPPAESPWWGFHCGHSERQPGGRLRGWAMIGSGRALTGSDNLARLLRERHSVRPAFLGRGLSRANSGSSRMTADQLRRDCRGFFMRKPRP